MSIDKDSDEVKALIAEAVEEAVGGLKAKNNELLSKVKKLQSGQQIDPADLEAIERERDEWKQKAGEASKTVTKLTKERDEAAKRAESAEGYTTKLLVDNGLNDALAKAGVTNPVHIKAAKAMLGAQAQVVVDGEAKVVRVGDKPLADFVTEWASGDEGKHFVTAVNGSGGGAGDSRNVTHNPPKGDSGGDKNARLARANELLAQHGE
jgi:hypothetical protein